METALLLDHDVRRVSLAEYHRMIEAGMFASDERLELLEGVLAAMSPQSERHAVVIERLADPLFTNLPRDCVVRCRLPLALGDASEPEPGIAVLARSTPRTAGQPPTSALLVIEVSGPSLRKDREVKGAVYARAAIPEYLIVNLDEGKLEVRREPDAATGRYASTRMLARGDVYRSSVVPGFGFDITALLSGAAG